MSETHETDPAGPLVEHATRHPDDLASHIERINPGLNPAFTPGASGEYPVPPEPMADHAQPQAYVALGRCYRNARIYNAGDILMLHAEEVGPNFRPLTEGDLPPEDSWQRRQPGVYGLSRLDRDRLRELRAKVALTIPEMQEEAALASREGMPRPMPVPVGIELRPAEQVEQAADAAVAAGHGAA